MSATVLHSDVARREEVTRLGLWLFLATVAMLFAAFTSAYIVRRSGSDWSAMPLPAILWLNTIVLGVSSLALEAGWHWGSRERWPPAHLAFAVAVALGTAFLWGQWLAWRQLQQAGIYLPANPSSSFFYMMTGAHALHVCAALIVLVRAALLTWRGLGQRHPRSWAGSIGLCRTFWHFLFGVWVYLFVIISTL